MSLETPTLTLAPTRFARILAAVAVILVLAHVLCQVFLFDDDGGKSDLIANLFHVDRENSVPMFFSAMMLLLVAILAAFIAAQNRGARFYRHWIGLAIVFLLMSLDEAASIHEMMVGPLRRTFNLGGALYFSWVIPGALFVLAFGATYVPFLRNLPTRFRRLFLISAAIFVGGALGVELIGGYYVGTVGYDAIYLAITTIEEVLEMIGVIVFIYTLMSYLANSPIVKLQFSEQATEET